MSKASLAWSLVCVYCMTVLWTTNLNKVELLVNKSTKQIINENIFDLIHTKYRSIVGALQYLTFTRPDIAFSVSQACQFMHHLMESHVVAVK